MAQDLDTLAAEAATLDAEAAPVAADAPIAAEPAAAVPAIAPEESLAGLLTVMGYGAGYAGFPTAAALWTPDTCRALADKAVPVMVKYAWGQRFLAFLQSGAGVEEIALFATAAPLVLATVKAVRADLKPAAPTAAPDAAPARPE